LRKANWAAFRSEVYSAVQNIESIAANYGVFVETLHKSRDGGFPAAARRQYIPGLSTNRQFDV